MTLPYQQLTEKTWLATVHWHEELPSTQALAQELVQDPTVELPCLILADRQTAGRGRGAHRWWTGPGALALSLIVDPSRWTSGVLPPNLAIAVGLSIVHSVNPLLPADAQAGLRWPNDVYIGSRKIAGILTEVTYQRRVLIGVGINTNNQLLDAPAQLANKVGTLFDYVGRIVDHQEFLIRWLAELDAAMNLLFRDPEMLAQEVNRHCLQQDEYLVLYVGDQQVSGYCRGIATDGALLIETERGVERYLSGSLSGPENEG
jgi:BirA family transcriptional regulator, biotin operon repressor / biotin---[acetyl-CoA-carboxylase] ligase